MIDRNGSFDKVEVSGINGSGYYEAAIEYNQTDSEDSDEYSSESESDEELP